MGSNVLKALLSLGNNSCIENAFVPKHCALQNFLLSIINVNSGQLFYDAKQRQMWEKLIWLIYIYIYKLQLQVDGF